MASLIVDRDNCNLCGKCVESCPFSAISIIKNDILINSACKLCKICIKACPTGAIRIEDALEKHIDKSQWKGVMVYVEHNGESIHPVTLDLIGKANELAHKLHQPVYCVYIGSGIIAIWSR